MREIHINGKWLAQSMTGTQRYANEMVRALLTLAPERRFVVDVPADAEVPEWLVDSGARVHRSRWSGVAFEQLDLPLTTRGALLLNFAGPAPLLKRKQLVTMHDATPFRFSSTFRRSFVAFYAVMYFLLSRTAAHLVTVSRFSAGELADFLHVPAERFDVAHCAADGFDAVDEHAPDLGDTVDIAKSVVVVGTLAQHKNLPEPVNALVSEGFPVIVVGASGNPQVFSDASPLAAGATVAGRLDDAELAYLYRHCRALVFPSRYEGFGLPVVEAQVSGCPVVCSDAASIPEVAGEAAVFFAPGDAQAMIDAVRRVSEDTGLRTKLIRMGHDNARRFSWRLSAERVLEAITPSIH
ncbi:glycosyltransferase family 4 protein [Gordonia sputi]